MDDEPPCFDLDRDEDMDLSLGVRFLGFVSPGGPTLGGRPLGRPGLLFNISLKHTECNAAELQSLTTPFLSIKYSTHLFIGAHHHDNLSGVMQQFNKY